MNLSEKRILVTGANGFVGGHLCKVLSDQGSNVVSFVRKPSSKIQHIAEQQIVDIRDRLRIRQLVKNLEPQFVVHLASEKRRSVELTAYRSGYESNFFGSLNLIEVCQELKPTPRFIYLGSCEEYGQQQVPFEELAVESPLNAYGASKLAVTKLLQGMIQNYAFPAVILRPTVVYGPSQSEDMFLPTLIQSLMANKRFAMTSGDQSRDFLYVDDLIEAIMLTLVTPGAQGRVINISSAKPIRIKALAKMTAQMIGRECESLLAFGAKGYRPDETMNYWASNSLAKELLDWTPRVSLEEGLSHTIGYFQDQIACKKCSD